MNCLEATEQLQRCLDEGDVLPWDHRGLTPSARLELDEHLKECASCRELFSAARRLSRGLALLPAADVPAGFAERVTRQVLRQRQMDVRFQWAFRAAAAVLLGMLGLWLVSRINQPDAPIPAPGVTDPGLAKDATPAPLKNADPPSLAMFQARMRETRERTLQATEDTARGARLLLGTTEQLTSAGALSIDAPVSMGDVTRNVGEGLEPVTDSAKRAWGMFRRLIPPGEERKKG